MDTEGERGVPRRRTQEGLQGAHASIGCFFELQRAREREEREREKTKPALFLALFHFTDRQKQKKTSLFSPPTPPLSASTLSMARGRGRGRGRGRIRSEKDLSADEGTSSSDDDAGDALGAIDFAFVLFCLFLKAPSSVISNELPINGEFIERSLLMRKSWIEISRRERAATRRHGTRRTVDTVDLDLDDLDLSTFLHFKKKKKKATKTPTPACSRRLRRTWTMRRAMS